MSWLQPSSPSLLPLLPSGGGQRTAVPLQASLREGRPVHPSERASSTGQGWTDSSSESLTWGLGVPSVAWGEVGGEGAVLGHKHGVVIDSTIAAADLHLDRGHQRWGRCNIKVGQGSYEKRDGIRLHPGLRVTAPYPRPTVPAPSPLGRAGTALLTGGRHLLALGKFHSVGQVRGHDGGGIVQPPIAPADQLEPAWRSCNQVGHTRTAQELHLTGLHLAGLPLTRNHLTGLSGIDRKGRSRCGSGCGPTHVERICRAAPPLPEGLRGLMRTPAR